MEEKKIKVIYEITKEAQKKDITNGGSGKKYYEISLSCTEELLKLSDVDKDGKLSIHTKYILNEKFPKHKDNFEYMDGYMFSEKQTEDSIKDWLEGLADHEKLSIEEEKKTQKRDFKILFLSGIIIVIVNIIIIKIMSK